MSSGVTWWRHQMETFSVLLALCTGNSPVTVSSPQKGQWRRALMFSLICTWINDWVNKGEAGVLRCHRPHYDVTVMLNTDICSTSVIPVIYAVFLFCHSIKMRLYCLLFLWCVQYTVILNSVIMRISYTNTWKKIMFPLANSVSYVLITWKFVPQPFMPYTAILLCWLFVAWCCFNTLRPRQNGHHFPDDSFKCIFLNENI